eukprot:37366_1
MSLMETLSPLGQTAILETLEEYHNGPDPDIIMYCDYVFKISEKNKRLKRILVVSEHALLLLLPRNYQPKRYIPMGLIRGIQCGEKIMTVLVRGSHESRLHARDPGNLVKKICAAYRTRFSKPLRVEGTVAVEFTADQDAAAYRIEREKTMNRQATLRHRAEQIVKSRIVPPPPPQEMHLDAQWQRETRRRDLIDKKLDSMRQGKLETNNRQVQSNVGWNTRTLNKTLIDQWRQNSTMQSKRADAATKGRTLIAKHNSSNRSLDWDQQERAQLDAEDSWNNTFTPDRNFVAPSSSSDESPDWRSDLSKTEAKKGTLLPEGRRKHRTKKQKVRKRRKSFQVISGDLSDIKAQMDGFGYDDSTLRSTKRIEETPRSSVDTEAYFQTNIATTMSSQTLRKMDVSRADRPTKASSRTGRVAKSSSDTKSSSRASALTKADNDDTYIRSSGVSSRSNHASKKESSQTSRVRKESSRSSRATKVSSQSSRGNVSSRTGRVVSSQSSRDTMSSGRVRKVSPQTSLDTWSPGRVGNAPQQSSHDVGLSRTARDFKDLSRSASSAKLHSQSRRGTKSSSQTVRPRKVSSQTSRPTNVSSRTSRRMNASSRTSQRKNVSSRTNRTTKSPRTSHGLVLPPPPPTLEFDETKNDELYSDEEEFSPENEDFEVHSVGNVYEVNSVVNTMVSAVDSVHTQDRISHEQLSEDESSHPEPVMLHSSMKKLPFETDESLYLPQESAEQELLSSSLSNLPIPPPRSLSSRRQKMSETASEDDRDYFQSITDDSETHEILLRDQSALSEPIEFSEMSILRYEARMADLPMPPSRSISRSCQSISTYDELPAEDNMSDIIESLKSAIVLPGPPPPPPAAILAGQKYDEKTESLTENQTDVSEIEAEPVILQSSLLNLPIPPPRSLSSKSESRFSVQPTVSETTFSVQPTVSETTFSVQPAVSDIECSEPVVLEHSDFDSHETIEVLIEFDDDDDFESSPEVSLDESLETSVVSRISGLPKPPSRRSRDNRSTSLSRSVSESAIVPVKNPFRSSTSAGNVHTVSVIEAMSELESLDDMTPTNPTHIKISTVVERFGMKK